MPSPLAVDDLQDRVHKAIEHFLSARAATLAAVSDDCAPLVGYAADLLSGGKRLRAALCYWAWRAAGAPDEPAIVAAAAALEFFQAAALIHDDVMDASDMRRGAPAVHRRFTALHRANRWAGDADHFGLSAAVLVGDLCLAWSDELYTSSGLPADALARGRTTFNLMRTQLMGGQYLDLIEQAADGRDPAGALHRARQVIRFKSAKYSVEQPLLLGAELAGAGPDLLAGLSAFGLPLGEAFQLRDDILGVFGDTALTGKPAGDDLREGKRTVLVALTLRDADPVQKKVFAAHFGDPGLDAAGVARLREIIVATGALAATEEMITSGLRESLTALHTIDIDPRSRSVLATLARNATDRTF
ncbi:polyprenyl synthetase family protein [Actinoplanes awajinensis]|uniref:Polyprenyl synthetase n=1 Tax=Actinoplanes awajinensis subsp. mycoplanecinus TaxID=135947 RepID=A0A101JH52_9ACTN|nr:polyprenyl synthetase family protein [Actinoplanes awajinensis]KUL26346.1 polyprenyl synthetase [Actinoplanes awajinensis subsp. mycoplanecinus]